MIKNYNKLVRDNIPNIIRENGEYARCRRKISDEEYERLLNDKLKEELKEVINAITKEEITEELADLLEVILSKAKNNNISFDEIERIRRIKKDKKGGFDKRVLLAYTYTDDDIKNLPRRCKTCAIKNTCTLDERLNEEYNPKSGELCIEYIPELYEQKTGKTR